jgi:hypothetical protein
LIVRNKVANEPEDHGLVLIARTSTDGLSFGGETTLLENTSQSLDNICDMIDARPIWDGSQWHIYMQARIGTPGMLCPNNTNHIVEARGSSLNPPTSNSFQWVKETGTNHARKIITGTSGSDGIGEGMQWYNPSAYGLPGFPFMVTYNDWGCSAFELCNHAIFNYLSEDDSDYNYWYGPDPDADPKEDAPYWGPSGFGSVLHFPDGILLASLDAGRQGNPGIGFETFCYEADTRYRYGKGIGFFNNPSLVPFTSPNPNKAAWAFGGALESVASDSGGPRMFVTKVARNEYGYIPPQSYHGFPRTWVSYLYYNPSQIKANNVSPASGGCGGYDYKENSQSIAVSRLTITEKSSQRVQS